MLLKTVQVTYSRTVSPKPYHSQKVEMTAMAECEDGDTDIEVAKALRQFCRNHVMTELARSDPKLKEKTDSLNLSMEDGEDVQ